MKKRDLSLGQYGISKHRYRELLYFCLQYPEWKEQLAGCYDCKASTYSGNPYNSSGVSDPTMTKAMRAAALSKNIKLIEQTAIDTDAELYQWILKAVTHGIGFEWLQIPCHRNKFILLRHRFYFLLDKKK